MNSVFKLLTLASITLSCSFIASANVEEQCGEIRLIHDLSKPSVFRVATVNGVEIENKFRLDVRENRLVLPVGEHSLQIAEEPQMIYSQGGWGGASQIKDYYESKTIDAYLFSQIKTHFAAIDVKANKAYVFSLTSDKNSLKLKKVVDKQCQISRSEEVQQVSTKQMNVEVLDEVHRNKLYQLSKLLGRGVASTDVSGKFLPLSVLTYFGVVVDDEFDDGAIKLLSVQPLSSAFKLGLRSGDKIIQFNRRTSKQFELNPAELLERFISYVHYYDDMTIIIKRDGNREIIKGKYEPILIPEVWMKSTRSNVALSNQKRLLDWHEQLFYSAFLRELVEKYQGELEQTDRLTISAKARKNSRLGLSGELTEQGHMKLSFVDPYSVFSSLNISAGDEIISYGKQKHTPITIKAFTRYFNSLSLNELFHIEVKTKNGIEQLSGNYKTIEYPAFELVLDIASVRNAEQNILLAYETFRKERKKSRYRFKSRWKSKSKLRYEQKHFANSIYWNRNNANSVEIRNNRPRSYPKNSGNKQTTK